MMSCRACGDDVAKFAAVKAAVQREMTYTDEDMDSGAVAVRVWHLGCAVADGRIDPPDADEMEERGERFYWEARRA